MSWGASPLSSSQPSYDTEEASVEQRRLFILLTLFSKNPVGGTQVVQGSTIGTLSKDDDNGSENVGKTMNLRSFKLNRVYLD